MRRLANWISLSFLVMALALPLTGCDVEEQGVSTLGTSAFVELDADQLFEMVNDDSVTILDMSNTGLQGSIPGAHPFPADLGESWKQLKDLDPYRDYLIVAAGDVDVVKISETIGDRILGSVFLYRGNLTGWNDANVAPNHLGPPIVQWGTQTKVIKPDHLKRSIMVPAFRPYMTVGAHTAAELMDDYENLRIIDVSPGFADGHIPGAESFPYSGMGFVNPVLLVQDPTKPYLVYGTSEIMAKVAARAMVSNGFEMVFLLKGNLKAWEDAGYPVEMSKLEVVNAPRPGDDLVVPDELVGIEAKQGPADWEELMFDPSVGPPDPTAEERLPANWGIATK